MYFLTFLLGIIKNKYQYSGSTFEVEVQSWFRTAKLDMTGQSKFDSIPTFKN